MKQFVESIRRQFAVDSKRLWLGPFLLISAALLYRPTLRFVDEFSARDDWFAFYPLLFLPVFAERMIGRRVAYDAIEISSGALLYAIGYITGVHSMMWLGGLWLLLVVCAGFGLRFHMAGRLLLLLVPPVSEKFALVAGFSLRLQLSELAGYLLHFFGPVEVHGALILFRNVEFMVDPACSGLRMLNALVLIGLLLHHFYGDKIGANFKNKLFAAALLPVAFLLWLGTNLLRIVILVLFHIPTDSLRHGAAGLGLFLAIVAFPLLLLCFLYYSEPPGEQRSQKTFSISPAGAFLICVLLWLVVVLLPHRTPQPAPPWPDSIHSFQRLDADFGRALNPVVTAYGNTRGRLIVKRGLQFFSLGHPPRLCWQGLGFRLTHEFPANVAQLGAIQRAGLLRDGQRFEMAYWYEPLGDDFRGNAISEIDWRWRQAVYGSGFLLVNVIAPDLEALDGFLLEMGRERVGGFF